MRILKYLQKNLSPTAGLWAWKTLKVGENNKVLSFEEKP